MARTAAILLVDDDANDALLVRKAAQKTLAGIPILVVSNGQEAVHYLQGEGIYADRSKYPFPDIVLLDLKMPIMNGFEVLRWVRSQPKLRRLPVILLTSSSQTADINRAYDLGANSFLVKPPDLDSLTQLVKTVANYWVQTNVRPVANA